MVDEDRSALCPRCYTGECGGGNGLIKSLSGSDSSLPSRPGWCLGIEMEPGNRSFRVLPVVEPSSSVDRNRLYFLRRDISPSKRSVRMVLDFLSLPRYRSSPSSPSSLLSRDGWGRYPRVPVAGECSLGRDRLGTLFARFRGRWLCSPFLRSLRDTLSSPAPVVEMLLEKPPFLSSPGCFRLRPRSMDEMSPSCRFQMSSALGPNFWRFLVSAPIRLSR